MQWGNSLSCVLQENLDTGPKRAASPTDKVFRLIAQDLEVDWLVAKGVSCQDVYSSHYSAAGRLVVMKQIATKQDQVNCLLLGILKDFFKCDKRIVFANFIFFPHALQTDVGLTVCLQSLYAPTDFMGQLIPKRTSHPPDGYQSPPICAKYL